MSCFCDSRCSLRDAWSSKTLTMKLILSRQNTARYASGRRSIPVRRAGSRIRLTSPENLELSPSSSPYLYQSWYLPLSPENPLLPAGLPVHLTPLFPCLRFGYCWPLCMLINYIYLLTNTSNDQPYVGHYLSTNSRPTPIAARNKQCAYTSKFKDVRDFLTINYTIRYERYEMLF